MIWAAMSSAGVGPLCFLKSTVNAAIYQDILEHFMLPSADKLYGDADFIFQQDLAPAHTAKGTKSWFNGHGVTVLDWPANSPDVKLIEFIWCYTIWFLLFSRGRWETPDSTMQMTWRPLSELCFHYSWAVPQADFLRLSAIRQVGSKPYWSLPLNTCIVL